MKFIVALFLVVALADLFHCFPAKPYTDRPQVRNVPSNVPNRPSGPQVPASVGAGAREDKGVQTLDLSKHS